MKKGVDIRGRNVVASVFQSMEIPYDEAIMFILMEFISFKFQPIKYSKLNNIDLWYASGRNEDYMTTVMKKLGITPQCFCEDNPERYIEVLEEYLSQGKSVICNVDDELYEDYIVHRSETVAAIRYLSCVQVLEINREQQYVSAVCMAKGNNVTYVEQRKIELSLFKRSAYSNIMPTKPNGSGYIFEKDSTYLSISKVQIKRLIKESLTNIVTNMLEGKQGQEAIYGIKGLEAIKAELAVFKELLNKVNPKKAVYTKIYDMRFRVVRKMLFDENIQLYRNEFGEALNKAGDILGIEELKKVGQEFIKLGKKWLNLNRTISVAFLQMDKTDIYITKLIGLLDEIIEYEKKVFKMLGNIIIAF